MKRPRCPKCDRAMTKETYWYCTSCGLVYNPSNPYVYYEWTPKGWRLRTVKKKTKKNVIPTGFVRRLEIIEEEERVRFWLDKIYESRDPIERMNVLRQLVKSVKTGRDDIDVIRKVVKRGRLGPELQQIMALGNPSSLYKKFHGVLPTRTRKVNYEPPNPKQPLIKIGRLSQLNYIPEFPSKRIGIEYYHKSGDVGHKTLKSNLILATDLKGKNLYLIRDGKSKYPIVTGRGIIG